MIVGAVLIGLAVLIWFFTSGIAIDVSERTSAIGLLVAGVLLLVGAIAALIGVLKGLRSKDEAIDDVSF